MRFPCHPVDVSFFDTAPLRFRSAVELEARPAEVFAIFEDAEAWPKWFPGLRKVTWTSDRPFGVGTTRTVSFPVGTVDESFIRWEQDHRFSFYLTGVPVPLTHAFADDFLLEEVAPGRTRFTYCIAIEPRLPVRLAGPLGRAPFQALVERACKALQRYVRTAR